MMLHEAVMLEIYRQALSASELASPRCQSRESTVSAAGAGGDARCPSNESHCSANDCLTPAPTPTPSASSPLGLPLTATLAPSAAAALLPPQSAAMAAYLAAAQQNHLLLTNPLAAAASLVQQATNPHNQQREELELEQEEEEEAPALDFSRKRAPSVCSVDEEQQEGAGEQEREEQEREEQEREEQEQLEQDAAPLDLSVSRRKRQTTAEQEAPPRKQPRVGGDYKSPLPPGSWVPPMNPYLAAVKAARPSEVASKALEKMSEMSRLETPPPAPVSSRAAAGGGAAAGVGGAAATGGAAGGRHSAWQSHWLNKGADAAKDVFKCVWCKQSFATLALLTTHMKETQHCGVQVPSPSAGAGAGGGSSNAASATLRHTAAGSSNCSSSTSSSSSSTNSSNSSKSELNMLIKETMPLPRKLVRGQDVWLGKGAEQTRQILKCMWCGQSFRSLAEMTSHMQETQHYTNIISQEQIISWKSGDERPVNGGGGAAASPHAANSSASASVSASAASSTATPTVSAVLTCKVCDQAFGTLKELSTHMAQQSHYKDTNSNGAGSSCSSVSPPVASSTGSGAGASKRGRQTRQEKRKKSLPVRKLLELERSGGGGAGLGSSLDSALKPLRDFAAATKITCEKCGSKIETALFVEHIRKCLGESIPIPPRRQPNQEQQQQRLASPSSSGSSSNAPSVLNALEQLIEKSFESRVGRLATGYSEAGTPLGASILKRLGIDDSSDYTKPLMDAQAMQMQLLRSTYPSRDRSASESSSASRVESTYTPDRQLLQPQQQPPTPRRTPETPTAASLPPPAATTSSSSSSMGSIIKSEPLEAGETEELPRHLIHVKKEFSMDAAANPRESPGAGSERSNNNNSPAVATSAMHPTPLAESGSLLALNSMFDQLSGVEHNNNNNSGHCYNNNNNTQIGSKKPKAHPLAALQKLCETTDPPASNTRSASVSSASGAATTVGSSSGSGSGNDMVAFSWACNEAVLSASAGAAAELIIKCSFCDTPFGSKGAYRHHLSKVHFVKEAGAGGEDTPPLLKSPAAAQSPKTLPLASPKRAASRSPATPAVQPLLAQSVTATATATATATSPYDESPQSKFLKYTELAKQLSSKNA